MSRSCDDCGRCGLQSVMKVWIPPRSHRNSGNLNNSRCYDVVVDGFRRAEGSYQLEASCCTSEMCSGHGWSKHISSSLAISLPSLTNATCYCDCRWPYAGPRCNECQASSLKTYTNGSCESCFSSAKAELVALHHSNLTWARPWCRIPSPLHLNLSSGTSPSLVHRERMTSKGGGRSPAQCRNENARRCLYLQVLKSAN